MCSIAFTDSTPWGSNDFEQAMALTPPGSRLLEPWPRPGVRGVLGGGALLAAYLWALSDTAVRLSALRDGVPSIADFVSRLLPPSWAMTETSVAGRNLFIPEVVMAVVETLQMALVGTSIAIAAALPLGLLAARNTSPHHAVYQ